MTVNNSQSMIYMIVNNSQSMIYMTVNNSQSMIYMTVNNSQSMIYVIVHNAQPMTYMTGEFRHIFFIVIGSSWSVLCMGLHNSALTLSGLFVCMCVRCNKFDMCNVCQHVPLHITSYCMHKEYTLDALLMSCATYTINT